MIWAWLRARAAGRPQLPPLAAPVIVAVAFLANDAVKSLLHEVRPCQVLHTIPLQACPGVGDRSFPSNHAAVAAATAGAPWFTDRRIALIALPAAVLMAFSRVWVGAHYPHDVIADLLLGAAVAGVRPPSSCAARPAVPTAAPPPRRSWRHENAGAGPASPDVLQGCCAGLGGRHENPGSGGRVVRVVVGRRNGGGGRLLIRDEHGTRGFCRPRRGRMCPGRPPRRRLPARDGRSTSGGDQQDAMVHERERPRS
ncbi:phosphatase PAP2 family protein [Streptomyces sp. NPDC006552]|uniref:phosphatase PAP2 family protein n=1 Tax=Streptomyces sp. NPDC006552 TaxID=3157179 RepID=UPI0033B2927B